MNLVENVIKFLNSIAALNIFTKISFGLRKYLDLLVKVFADTDYANDHLQYR